MTVAAIIQARMGSTRLPGKILKDVGGRTLLDYMLGRVRAAKTLDSIAVATTTLAQDDPVEEYCRRTGVAVLRGSEDDVLDRYYRCALMLGADAIVRLTADCPLMDPRVIDEVVGDFLQGGCDYAANTAPPPGSYPDGMDVEVFSFAALERAWKEAKKPSEREHVTFYFWKNPGLFRIRRHEREEDLSGFRLTVDYPQDLALVTRIIAHFQPGDPLFSMTDIVAFLKQHPELRAVNGAIAPAQGWKPALEKDKQPGG